MELIIMFRLLNVYKSSSYGTLNRKKEQAFPRHRSAI